jgi:serine/threonine-protein kinase
MYVWQQDADGIASLERAHANFEAALAIDSDYADAHWGMFIVWDRMHRNAHYPFDESLERMQSYSGELQRLAPGSDRALSAASRLALLNYDFHQAAKYLEQAVQRYPGNVTVLGAYANLLPTIRQYHRALEIVGQAEKLDPLAMEIMRAKSFTLYRMGDCRGVETVMNHAIGIEPDVGRFRYYLAMCLYETTGDAALALPFAEAELLDWAHETALAILYQVLGDTQAAEQQLESLLARAGEGASYQFGQIYAQWGDTGKALDWLETAVKVRDPGLVQAGDDRLLLPLQGEPRFEQLLRDVGHR